MGALIRIPAAANPADRVLSRFTRGQLASFIEVAISLLDAADSDPDVELNGDELDGINSEDDFWPHSQDPYTRGPGCSVSDPDMAVDDQACDEGRVI